MSTQSEKLDAVIAALDANSKRLDAIIARVAALESTPAEHVAPSAPSAPAENVAPAAPKERKPRMTAAVKAASVSAQERASHPRSPNADVSAVQPRTPDQNYGGSIVTINGVKFLQVLVCVDEKRTAPRVSNGVNPDGKAWQTTVLADTGNTRNGSGWVMAYAKDPVKDGDKEYEYKIKVALR